jgi:hypothetical protein
VGRGALTQSLVQCGLPPSLRRGNVEVLIAQQQLNVRSWTNCTRRAWRFTPRFTIDRWNPSEENSNAGWQENVTTQRTRFEAGVADKSALVSATVQTSELDYPN